MNKWVRSYPFLVSFFLIGELSLSLGVSEPRHILEVTHYKHIGFWERLLNTMGFDALVSFTYLNRIYRKSNICMPFLNVEQNSGYVSQSKLIPYFSAYAPLS